MHNKFRYYRKCIEYSDKCCLNEWPTPAPTQEDHTVAGWSTERHTAPPVGHATYNSSSIHVFIIEWPPPPSRVLCSSCLGSLAQCACSFAKSNYHYHPSTTGRSDTEIYELFTFTPDGSRTPPFTFQSSLSIEWMTDCQARSSKRVAFSGTWLISPSSILPTTNTSQHGF